MSTIYQSWAPPMEAQDEMVDILTESYSNNRKYTFGGISWNGCLKMNDAYGSEGDDETETVFKMIAKCIHEIHEGDTIHNKIDISDKELDEFVENLPTDASEKVQNFFETMPKVRHVVKVKNPKTKKTGEVVIEGLENYFG